MKTLILLVITSVIFFSCEKDDLKEEINNETELISLYTTIEINSEDSVFFESRYQDDLPSIYKKFGTSFSPGYSINTNEEFTLIITKRSKTSANVKISIANLPWKPQSNPSAFVVYLEKESTSNPIIIKGKFYKEKPYFVESK